METGQRLHRPAGIARDTLRGGLIVRQSTWVLVIAAILQCGIHAQQRGQAGAPAITLTALDYFEIQQLVAKYARAIDTCSNNGYDYADLFTADGAFIPSFEGKQLAPIQGRERLAAVSGGGTNGCKNVPWIEQ